MEAFYCTHCKARLVLTTSESDSLFLSGRTANPRLDESFLLLEEALASRGQGQHAPGAGVGGAHEAAKQRPLEESFIMLQSHRPPAQPAGAAADASAQTARVPLDQTLRAVARVFEVATDQSQVGRGGPCAEGKGKVAWQGSAQRAGRTALCALAGPGSTMQASAGAMPAPPRAPHAQPPCPSHPHAHARHSPSCPCPPTLPQVDHPLCTDCAGEVHKELEAQLSDLQQEVAAYEAALQALEAERAAPLEEGQFQAQLRRAQEEAAAERCGARVGQPWGRCGRAGAGLAW